MTKHQRKQMAIKRVMRRDGDRCAWCSTTLTRATATLDHALPVVAGGSNWWSSLILACGPCNSRRGDRELAEHADALAREGIPVATSVVAAAVERIATDERCHVDGALRAFNGLSDGAIAARTEERARARRLAHRDRDLRLARRRARGMARKDIWQLLTAEIPEWDPHASSA